MRSLLSSSVGVRTLAFRLIFLGGGCLDAGMYPLN